MGLLEPERNFVVISVLNKLLYQVLVENFVESFSQLLTYTAKLFMIV